MDTLADLKSNVNLAAGARVRTRGRNAIDDDGGAEYVISASTKGKGWAVPMANGLYALIDQKNWVTYRMFGALLNGIDDDDPYMRHTHEYANSIYTYDQTGEIKIYPCRVEQHDGIIYRKQIGIILVYTDMDLSGATILIDDNSASWNGWYWIGDSRGVYYSYSLNEDQKSQLTEGSHYFRMNDNTLPANTVIRLSEEPYACRDDCGYKYTVSRYELLAHDMHGICSGPLTTNWVTASGNTLTVTGRHTDLNQVEHSGTASYTTKYAISYNYVSPKRLTIKGCDVVINANANTYAALLYVHRHNTVVQDFTIRPHRDSLRNSRFRNSVFYARDCYNITFENIRGLNVAGRNDGAAFTATSGYLIRATNCMDVTVRNCRLTGYWGATAMDNVKDVKFYNCELNRIDVHDYFSNLYIDNCIIHSHGVQIGFGSGICSVTNTTFYCLPIKDMSYDETFVTLNATYGRVFYGTLILENIHIVADPDSGNPLNLLSCWFTPDANSLSDIFVFKLPEIRFRNITVECGSNRTINYMYFGGSHPSTLGMFRRAAFENVETTSSNTYMVNFAPEVSVTTARTGGAFKIASTNCLVYTSGAAGTWFGKSANPKPTMYSIGDI